MKCMEYRWVPRKFSLTFLCDRTLIGSFIFILDSSQSSFSVTLFYCVKPLFARLSVFYVQSKYGTIYTTFNQLLFGFHYV